MNYKSCSYAAQSELFNKKPKRHPLHFTYKKSKLISGKVNEAAKEIFPQELGKLEKELAQTDQLLYLDGVHPQHNSKPSYGWYEKGSKAVLLTNTGYKHININGA